MDREYLLVIERKKLFFESTRRVEDLLSVEVVGGLRRSMAIIAGSFAVISGLRGWIDAGNAGSKSR